jgi:hypothetical protein
MASTTFIDTKKEAKTAQEIAARYGWERDVEYFHKHYVGNLFVGYQNLDETRLMVREISKAISFDRSQKRAQRVLNTTKRNQKNAAYLEKIERASEIATRTGETVETVMQRI